MLWETQRFQGQWPNPSSWIEDFAKGNGSATITGTQQTGRREDLCVECGGVFDLNLVLQVLSWKC